MLGVVTALTTAPSQAAVAQTGRTVDPAALEVAERVEEELGSDPSFGGVSIDPHSGEPVLRWVGAVPDAVRRNAERSPVRLEAARYGKAALRDEARRLVEDRALTTGGVVTVTVAAPRPDGSGIDLEIEAFPVSTAQVRVRSSVDTRVARVSAPAFASRWDDSAPFYGGAVIRNWERGDYCSTAFAVKTSGRGPVETFDVPARRLRGVGGVVTGSVREPSNVRWRRRSRRGFRGTG